MSYLLTCLLRRLVTLYGPDSVVCSGSVFAASLNVCYNTTWTYYSVDGCTVPSISSSTPSSTSTSSSSSGTTTASSSSSSSSGPALSGGGLAGVIIVGIIALAAIVVAAIFFIGRRTRRLDRERLALEAAAADTESKPSPPKEGDAPRQYGSLGMSPVESRPVGYDRVYEAHAQPPVSEMPAHPMGELPDKPHR